MPCKLLLSHCKPNPDGGSRGSHVLRECSRFGLKPVLIDAVDMRGQPDEVLRSLQAAPEASRTARRTSRRHYLSAGALAYVMIRSGAEKNTLSKGSSACQGLLRLLYKPF